MQYIRRTFLKFSEFPFVIQFRRVNDVAFVTKRRKGFRFVLFVGICSAVLSICQVSEFLFKAVISPPVSMWPLTCGVCLNVRYSLRD